MEYFNLVILYCIFLVFLISAVDKLLHWEKHVSLAQAYKIVSGKLLKVSLLLFVIIEIYLIISILITGVNKYNLLSSLFVLLIYSFAIMLNILKGNKNISCGCGGILHSSNLNIGLIIRNLCFMICLIYLAEIELVPIMVPIYDQLFTILVSIFLIIFYATLKNINIIASFYNRLKFISEENAK